MLLLNFSRKLLKMLVEDQSFFSFFFRFANIVCDILLSANPLVSVITVQIILAVSVTGFLVSNGNRYF